MSGSRCAFSSLLLIFVLISVPLFPVEAAPPVPGTYDPVTLRFYESGNRIDQEPIFYAPLKPKQAYRTQWKVPVIFMHANDEAWTYTTADWEQLLFSVDQVVKGSFRDYYQEVSYELFDVTGDVMGWLTADYNYEHYHQYNYGFNGGAQEFAREAVMKAEAMYHPGWTQFDNDGDGAVDCVMIFHQGQGGESGGTPSQFWSHVSIFDTLTYDGVDISYYSLQPETTSTGQIGTIGTVCHEFGHLLGLPDLYDIGYTSKPEPVGKWCVMSSGLSVGNPQGSSPGHLSAWCRYKLGWVEPIVLDSPGAYTLQAVQLEPEDSVYQIPINGDSQEYFLLANRWIDHDLTFDHLPGQYDGGMLIYHVDERMPPSNDGSQDHWHVAVEDADLSTTSIADAAFCVEIGHTEFSPKTSPDSNGYYEASNVTIDNISARSEFINCNVTLGPVFRVESSFMNPLGSQQYEIVVEAQNVSAMDAQNVWAEISTACTNVVFDDSTCTLGQIPPDGIGSNQDNPFRLHTLTTIASIEMFTLTIHSLNFGSMQLTFELPVNPSRFLLLDNDKMGSSASPELEMRVEEALTAISADYQTWDVALHGYPSVRMLNTYKGVIWNDWQLGGSSKSEDGLELIKQYLDSGGTLFWSNQEFFYWQYPYSMAPEDDFAEPVTGEFAHDYLHITQLEQDEYYYSVSGVSGSIFDGCQFEIPDCLTASNFHWYPDEVVTDGLAQTILTAGNRNCAAVADPEVREACFEDANFEEITNGAAAILIEGSYNLIFMTIPFQCMEMTAPAPNNRGEFMQRVINWMESKPDSTPTPVLDTPTPYPSASTPTMTPTPMPTIVPTYTPGNTPTPEFTPSPTVPPTETPFPLGVRLEMPSAIFHPGDTFYCKAYTDNPGDRITGINLFVMLDVGIGTYWFWPGWKQYPSEIDYTTFDLEKGSESHTILDAFEWPAGTGSASGINFIAGMVDPGMTSLMGELAQCEFAWEE